MRYSFPTITTLALTICRLVIREHFQLPLDQRFHVLEDLGKIAWRSGRIESQVSFDVLLKLPLSNFGRAAGHIPGAYRRRSDDSASLQSFRPRQGSLPPFPRSSRTSCAWLRRRSSLVESFLASNVEGCHQSLWNDTDTNLWVELCPLRPFTTPTASTSASPATPRRRRCPGSRWA